jgi:hypothetical protein
MKKHEQTLLILGTLGYARSARRLFDELGPRAQRRRPARLVVILADDLFPLVAYRRVRRFDSDTEGIVVAESRAYLSPDILHSNAFVQYVNEDTIRHYQGVFKSAGRTLKHVHFWSDGCGAQFKNKNQFYWLLTGSKLATDESPTPLRIAHHFFQSCHGKGQCQSCLSRSPAQPSPALSPARPSKGPALLISQPPSSALSQPGSALLIISQPSPAQPSPAGP